MDGNLSTGHLIPGGSSYGGLDLQGSMRINHHQHSHGVQHHNRPQPSSIPPQSMHDIFPLTMGHIHDRDQPNSMVDFGKMDRGKNSASDDDEPSFNEEGADGHCELGGKGKKSTIWQRVKWTDSMVRLLITAVSYIGEDAASECGPGGRRKYANLQKKGKWKSVSRAMAERGFYVSPQQCEDKFNDLNKRYKKLNDILGRGTSCQVVENPALLDMMDHLSDKLKEEVRKILSSKHLFYEEMCSYHNGNRLHLPPDPELQRSLQLALKSRDDHEMGGDSRMHHSDDLDEDDNEAESDEREEYEENRSRSAFGYAGDSTKRAKVGAGDLCFENVNFLVQPQNAQGEVNISLQKQWIKSRSVQLEEQKMQIELEMLELERQRFKWQKFSRKKDRELDRMKMENERMKLENERMVLELKRMEMSLKTSQSK